MDRTPSTTKGASLSPNPMGGRGMQPPRYQRETTA
jgi:hypothetical protein